MSLEENARRVLEAAKGEELDSRQVLTTTDCARVLGMSGAFIRGEIRDGRLKARILTNAGRRRASYRIQCRDFEVYQREHWRKAG